jgi:hypothetical protein
MNNCCVPSVPPDSSYEALAQPVSDWAARLSAGLNRRIQNTDESLGHLEEEILHQTKGLERAVLEEASQKKADQVPPHCPKCGHKLTRLSQEHERTYQSRFGLITIRRTRGWCKPCGAWRFPADHVLGLEETGSATPSVQEMAALVVSKMPVAEASAVLERLAGIKLPPATLDREARRQGKRAESKRKELDQQISSGRGHQQMGSLVEEPEPFTLVIQIDAWNIRERDDWGKSEKQRAKGVEPKRWHWVYAGTCFRLSQRAERPSGRSIILSRGTVMTRGGVDELREQLHAEALRQGLGKAKEVVIIADGAVWIWNLVADRFSQGRQQLDFFHASQHLWAVAHAVHPEDDKAARQWVQPLLKKLKGGRGLKVITQLQEVTSRLPAKRRPVAQKEVEYFQSHRNRMDYHLARKRGEPLGSGAIESTCRQYQCRFKRTGQFWSRTGDESLMCLETFWRNKRWHLLFPHSTYGDPAKN